MVELFVNGMLTGVFSSEESAKDHVEEHYQNTSFSIFPLGTTLDTDIDYDTDNV